MKLPATINVRASQSIRARPAVTPSPPPARASSRSRPRRTTYVPPRRLGRLSSRRGTTERRPARAPDPNVPYVRLRATSNSATTSTTSPSWPCTASGSAGSIVRYRRRPRRPVKKTTTVSRLDGSPLPGRQPRRPPEVVSGRACRPAREDLPDPRREAGRAVRVTLSVRDFVGRTGSVTRTFTVRDTLGPDVTIRTAGASVNRPVTIRGKLCRPERDLAKITVRFGDGTRATVTVRRGRYSVKHTYRSKSGSRSRSPRRTGGTIRRGRRGR